MNKVPNIALDEVVVLTQLIDIGFSQSSTDKQYKNWCMMYSDLLKRTNPERVSAVVSLALLCNVFLYRYQIGQEWFALRDRFRTYLEAIGEDADGTLKGLYDE